MFACSVTPVTKAYFYCNYFYVMNFLNLFILGLALGAYFALHSFFADINVKNFLTKRLISKRYYRFLYNFKSIILLFPLAWIYSRVSASVLVENLYLSYMGLSLMILGFILLGVSLRQYNLSEFSGLEQWMDRESAGGIGLKVSGLNAIVRHPLYTSSLILLWGWFLYQSTNVVLLIVIITTAYIYIGAKLEEQKLIKEFGTDYKAYQKRVNMLIPFIQERIK